MLTSEQNKRLEELGIFWNSFFRKFYKEYSDGSFIMVSRFGYLSSMNTCGTCRLEFYEDLAKLNEVGLK